MVTEDHTEGRPPDDDAAVREIIACAARTLDAPSARLALGYEWQNLPSADEFGPAARLIGAAVRRVWRRIGGDTPLRRGESVGFAEPATGRFMLDRGWAGEIGDGGTTFTGRHGRPLAELPPSAADRESGDALWLLRLVPGATEAGFEAAETLRGTACRRFAVRVDIARAEAASTGRLRPTAGISPGLGPSLPLTVWIGGQHVRQVRFVDQVRGAEPGPADAAPGQDGAGLRKEYTLELWDFGVPTDPLDWSRLPDSGKLGSVG